MHHIIPRPHGVVFTPLFLVIWSNFDISPGRAFAKQCAVEYQQGSAMRVIIKWMSQRPWFFRSLRVILAIAIAWLLNEFPFYSIESYSYDLRVKLRPPPKPTNHIALVAVDKETHTFLNREPDFADHVELLKAIRKDGPKAIIYTFSPTTMKGNLRAQKKWIKLTQQIPNFYVAVNDIISKGNEQRIQLPTPFGDVPTQTAVISSDSNKYAEDDVSRRLMIQVDGKATLHMQMAQFYNGIIDPYQYRGSFELLNSVQNYVDYAPAGTYPIQSFINIASQRFPLGTFTNKIVFVGRDTLEDAKDYVRTPYSKNIVAMSKLEAYANVLDTLIRNSSPIRAPYWFNLLLTACISLITVQALWRRRPVEGIFILFGTIISFCLLSYVLFAAFGLWITMAQPLLSVFICYYFFIPYRLIKENKKSWEYIQKNKLLTQVEELKTNFLSMMSHDLKTPLARIQGMADIVLQSGQNLTEDQRGALKNINNSSEELTYFISSILSLSRVESEAVKLHLQSRDVNAVLQEVVDKLVPLAKDKEIQLITEFEPLFSIKIDVDLIKQVFTNIIENAIKYSSQNSKVMISTEEVEGQIIIQVADQGIGIGAAELPNVFMKFYRSTDAKNSPIKGSGLGLYLAKYFIELHRGDISVESLEEQGSTFSVKLPTELNH